MKLREKRSKLRVYVSARAQIWAHIIPDNWFVIIIIQKYVRVQFKFRKLLESNIGMQPQCLDFPCVCVSVKWNEKREQQIVRLDRPLRTHVFEGNGMCLLIAFYSISLLSIDTHSTDDKKGRRNTYLEQKHASHTKLLKRLHFTISR